MNKTKTGEGKTERCGLDRRGRKTEEREDSGSL